MTTRSNFLKSELQKIYNNLNMSYEYADFSRLENDTKFIKVFELLMEISEKSNTLNKVVVKAACTLICWMTLPM